MDGKIEKMIKDLETYDPQWKLRLAQRCRYKDTPGVNHILRGRRKDTRGVFEELKKMHNEIIHTT